MFFCDNVKLSVSMSQQNTLNIIKKKLNATTKGR